MVKFQVFGPFKIGYDISRRGRGGRPKKIITAKIGRHFCGAIPKKHLHLASHKGCYVFTLSAGRGSMPWYVGKTEKNKRTLKQEVFAEEKLRKYKTILAKSRRRSPALYFLVRIEQQGPLGSAIDDLETLLIWIASHRNKSVLNKRKRDTQPARLMRIVNRIGIKGILNCNPGRPTEPSRLFETLMKFREHN